MKKIIITVIGKDAVGILAKTCTYLAKEHINILDISQTLMQEYFAMIMLVDLEACPLPFHELSAWLKEQGEKRALDIHIQREEIFEAMHRI